ncbi:amidase [Sorangium sp. So ce281]|uniref:amidase n=1 Tax=unclassified Sorangium TaxID=2621164 RepID=UPI003F62182C
MSESANIDDPGAAAHTGEISRRFFLRAFAGGVAALSGACDGMTPVDAPAAEALSELTRATGGQLADLIRRKRVSSLEVVEAHLARIAQINPRLNAVVKLRADEARAEARAADKALARGKHLGPLHGVPMTIKDSIDTAGVVTTGGTTGRTNFVPAEDATVVRRLKEAGAILLGKSNTPEMTWSYETNNAVYGRTNNPYGLDLSPGGSSGGAGAIVAAGGSPFDVGSDTGGSIRVPSHFCGIAGLKPTSGRISRTGHIVPAEGLLQSFTVLGPMARSVDDLWLLFSVLAGPDWRDAALIPAPLGDPKHVRLRELRIAMHTDNGIAAPDAAVRQAVVDAAAALEAGGARVESKKPDALSDVLTIDADIFRADGSAWLKRLLDLAGTTDPGAEVDAALASEPLSSGELTAAVERLDAWRGRMLGFMKDVDAIVCPPCVLEALPHDAWVEHGVYAGFSYSFAYNMTGWPAVVVRAGTSSRGTPVGVQIIGRPFREDVVLALAGHIERELGGYRAPMI